MLSALLTAFQTLTRIRVPSPRRAPDAAMLGASAIFYPLAGAVIGVAGFGLYRLIGDVLPRDIVMLGVLALWVLLTGALHEDGLADVCDAFGSQSRSEEILRVMKDSAIGTYGALGIVLALLLRWRALVAIAPEYTLLACVVSQVVPRAGIAPLAYWAGPATGGSGGSLAAGLRWWHVTGSVLLGGALVTLLAGDCMPVLYAAGVCVGVVVMLVLYFRRRLGGVTGDCLGVAVQLQEVGVLLTVLVWSTV